jgi:predicted anti-sigma-YlaC factor YlaD
MKEDELKRVACEAFEARLEDFLAGGEAGADLEAHLQRCGACREALENARLAGELLREGLRPAVLPHPAFASRVMAQIRAAEAEAAQGSDLWGALEVLARRLALTAAMALVLLGVYVGVFEAPQEQSNLVPTEANAKYPSVVSPLNSSDEILQAFVDNGHGR